MDKPRNITELKSDVRAHLVTNPNRRTIIRELANITTAQPDLFGWIRLWIVMQQDMGRDADSIIAAIVDGSDADGC